MPGPANSEGDRPPTNPAIRVRFPAETDGCFFPAVAFNYAGPDHLNYFSAKIVQRHQLDFSEADFTLSLCSKKEYIDLNKWVL